MQDKSHEELRWEDYQLGNDGGRGFGQFSATSNQISFSQPAPFFSTPFQACQPIQTSPSVFSSFDQTQPGNIAGLDGSLGNQNNSGQQEQELLKHFTLFSSSSHRSFQVCYSKLCSCTTNTGYRSAWNAPLQSVVVRLNHHGKMVFLSAMHYLLGGGSFVARKYNHKNDDDRSMVLLGNSKSVLYVFPVGANVTTEAHHGDKGTGKSSRSMLYRSV